MNPVEESCPIATNYRQLDLKFDRDRGALWYSMQPSPRPCFNPDLLNELRRLQSGIVRANAAAMEAGDTPPIRYTILASGVPGVFNLGGDLALFARLIRARDRWQSSWPTPRRASTCSTPTPWVSTNR